MSVLVVVEPRPFYAPMAATTAALVAGEWAHDMTAALRLGLLRLRLPAQFWARASLGHNMYVTDKRDESKRTPLQRLEDLNKAKPAAALLGLTIYGLARVSHDAFYAKLGVTVEEVGLDQSTILGRAALYFIFYLALGVSVGALAFAVVFSLTSRRTATPSSRNGQADTPTEGAKFSPIDPTFLVTTLFALSVPLVGIIAPQVLFTAVAIPEVDLLFFAKLAASLVLITMVILFFVSRWRDVEVYLRNLRISRTMVGIAILGLAVLSVTALGLAKVRGDFLGSKVREGRQVRAYRLELLSVRADPVCLRWRDKDLGELVKAGPYMFVGEADRTWVLYDWPNDQPIRVPAGEAVIVSATAVPHGQQAHREDTYRCA